MTNFGRGLFKYREEVSLKRNKLTKPKHSRFLSKLITGYCLHEYFHKIGVSEKPYCTCGEVESRELECIELEDLREQLKLKLLQQTGINMWSVDLFLEMNRKDEQFDNRMLIMVIFDGFLERSGRFTKNS